jgi:hypothetical protein
MPRQRIWTDPYEREEGFEETYLDSDRFDVYCELVRSVIYHAHEQAQREAAASGDPNWINAQRPVCTRDIHRALGKKARIDWTADALQAIGDIEEVGVLPTRYRPPKRSSTNRSIVQSQQELNARLFAETYEPLSKGETHDTQ